MFAVVNQAAVVLDESRRSRAKKCGFLKPQLKSLGVGGNLSFWKKSLSFLTISLSFSGSLSFFGLEFFSKCPKKKACLIVISLLFLNFAFQICNFAVVDK